MLALIFFSAGDMEAHSLVPVREEEGDVLCDGEGEVEAVRRPARMASWSLRGIVATHHQAVVHRLRYCGAASYPSRYFVVLFASC